MSVARINLVEFNSERDADEISADYPAKAPGEFPAAEILLQIRTRPTSTVAVSTYVDAAAMENAAEARKTRMERMKDRVKNVEMFEGEVNLSHSK